MYFMLLLCVLWCVYILYRQTKSGHQLPPTYPGGLPLFGHTFKLFLWRNDLYSFMTSMRDFCLKSGGVTCGFFVGSIYYCVVDPEDAHTVANSLLQKHPLIYKFGKTWVGKGLITAQGADYKHHRKLLNPMFSLPVTYGFLNIFNSQNRRLVEMFDTQVGRGPFNPTEMIKLITLRSTCLTVFGDSDEKDKEFVNKYTMAIDDIMKSLMARLIRPWMHSDFIYGFSNLKKIADAQVQALDKISYEVIQRKKLELKNNANVGNLFESDEMRPMIDLILEVAADGSLNDKEVRDELNTIVVASYETSTQQLIYIAVYVGSYPEVQEKMFKEIMEVVGDRDVEKQDLGKLVYTEAVIKECLRLIPPVPLLPRCVDRDLKLKNYTLRAGSYVYFMPEGIHRHSSWGPDAHLFKPERWLDKETTTKFANLNFSFSVGLRSCIGRKYAMTSLKVALVHIIRQFQVKADITKLKLKVDLTSRPASGHEISVERRNMKHDYNQNTLLFA